jgi:hypothetical protein
MEYCIRIKLRNKKTGGFIYQEIYRDEKPDEINGWEAVPEKNRRKVQADKK